MRARLSLRVLSLPLAFVASLAGVTPREVAAEQHPAGLHIVVIEGEDAVNIIQQKTAVAPVIEVRDRNDQPVAGAVVNFAIRSGRATFGGARTLSVTTNVAGRAVAAGFAPTGSGALQISATAAFQGQTAAAVTIAQTTVQTAAQAAAVSGASAGGAGGSGGATAGAGAGTGGGGGLSATTIGLVGAGAAAGAVVAVKELTGGTIYRGQVNGTMPMTFGTGAGACTRIETYDLTLEIEIKDENGTISGTAQGDGNLMRSPGLPCSAGNDPFDFDSTPVTGSNNRVTFNKTSINSQPPPNVWTRVFVFDGVLNGSEITGTLTISQEVGGPAGTPTNGRGSNTHSVTLR